jgi:hypothetical protein
MLGVRIGEKIEQAIDELQLVADRHLDVHPLHAVGVVAEALERDHDVLVDLERVRVPGDRGRARPVEPEFFPRLGRHRDETFAAARVRNADDLGRGFRDGIVGLADDVAEQHHVRAAVALGFRRVADRLHVARVEVLEARELHAPPVRARRRVVEVALDLDDRRRRFARLTEELEADGADRRRHPVQNKSRGHDDAVAAFLLNAGKPREEFIGDVLAETCLAKRFAGNRERLRAANRLPIVGEPAQLERRLPRIVDLAEIVIDARDLEPLRVGVTIRQDTRLSSAVPHSTAFLPPALTATLPPMHDASADVGSHANTSPFASATSIARLVTTPAPQSIVGVGSARPASTMRSTPESRSSFSVLITAERGSSGIAPPV